MSSIIMDFVKSNNFYEAFNNIWDYTMMDGVLANSPFHIVLASDCDDVFENNIDSDGCLNNLVTVDTNFKVKIPIEWKTVANNSRDVVIADDITLTIGQPVHDLKGVFFTVNYQSKDYVIAYMILPYYLVVTNQIIFPKDTVLVSVD